MRLFCLSDARLAELARTRVPAEDTRRQLDELLTGGCPPAALARYCRLTLTELNALRDAATCSELTALWCARRGCSTGSRTVVPTRVRACPPR